ncbi:MAG: hypothetical protein HOP29_10075 [Phycisphaerales bacterium]|nr:hypothetical protein [Phycisphaerales bacterium]
MNKEINMVKQALVIFVIGLGVIGAAAVVGRAQEKKANGEQEREVKEAEVPKAPLETLKALAGAATITEFAEEIEHGHKFYEGSWKGPNGNIDALVTESGDLVEIEETTPATGVPAAVRAEVEKAAGKEATLMWEKKTIVMYEVHFKKDGKGREMIFTPDGRQFHEEGAAQDGKDDDGDDDEKEKE